MNLAVDPLVLKILAFVLSASPIVWTSLRTGMIPHRYVSAFACTGLAVYVFEHCNDFDFRAFMHVLNMMTITAIAMIFLFYIGTLNGGAGKFLTAIVPWFSTWDLITLIAVASILTVPQIIAQRLIGRPKRNRYQVAPYIVMAGCLILGTGLR